MEAQALLKQFTPNNELQVNTALAMSMKNIELYDKTTLNILAGTSPFSFTEEEMVEVNALALRISEYFENGKYNTLANNVALKITALEKGRGVKFTANEIESLIYQFSSMAGSLNIVN